MIADEILAPVARDDASARFRQSFDAEHRFGGDDSEQHDELRVEELDLLEEVV